MSLRSGSSSGASTSFQGAEINAGHGAGSTGDCQIICTGLTGQGCRTLLVYPQGASNVRCSLCSTVTQVPSAASETAQLDCQGCHTRLMYARGASSVQCSVCHAVNIATRVNQVSQCTCGGCGISLMYASNAQSVKCAVCNFITSVTPTRSADHRRVSLGPEMVVVENPPTLNEAGKTVSNLSVGIVEP